MMKSIYKYSFFLLAFLPFVAIGQVDKSKEINKSYDVSAQGKLRIENKYGDVHIETWSQNRVEVNIIVKVQKSSESKAQEYLDKVEIDIDDNNKNDLSFVTMINGSINNRNGERLEIDYNVKAPVSFSQSLKNSYGSLYLGDSDGDVQLHIAYGNVKVDKLSGNVNLKVSYGNGEVESIGSGSLIVSYSNLSVEKIGNVELTNNYSNIDLGETRDVEVSNKYGNVTLDVNRSLKGFSKYGSVKAEKVYNSISMDITHGGGLKVNWISKDFTNIDVESSYASVQLKFEKGMSAQLDADMKYCDLKNYDIPFDHTFVDESGSQKEYRGKLGSGTGNSRIKIVSGYGNIKISYAD